MLSLQHLWHAWSVSMHRVHALALESADRAHTCSQQYELPHPLHCTVYPVEEEEKPKTPAEGMSRTQSTTSMDADQPPPGYVVVALHRPRGRLWGGGEGRGNHAHTLTYGTTDVTLPGAAWHPHAYRNGVRGTPCFLVAVAAPILRMAVCMAVWLVLLGPMSRACGNIRTCAPQCAPGVHAERVNGTPNPPPLHMPTSTPK